MIGWKILLLIIVFVSVKGQSIPDTKHIVESRGFIAIQHYVYTRDGYILSLIRVRNPYIYGGKSDIFHRRPILFVHGEKIDGTIFLVNSENATARDLSGENDLAKMTINEANKAYANEPLAKSLPLFASAKGHDVWILDRRGTPKSLGHVGYKAFKSDHSYPIGGSNNSNYCSTIDLTGDLAGKLKTYQHEVVETKYWNYSLDEQARNDLPQTIEYILRHVGNTKIALVGHSSGSALIMMMLALYPDISDWVSASIHFAPSIYQTQSRSPSKLKSIATLSSRRDYIGPYSLEHSDNELNCLVDKICWNKFGDLCLNTNSSTLYNTYAFTQYQKQTGKAVSSHQIDQLTQSNVYWGRLRFYSFTDPRDNLRHYGQEEPPAYNLSCIKSKTMYLWHGYFDTTATPTDVSYLIGNLSVPVNNTYYDEKRLLFDHLSPLLHENVSTLTIIPALKAIQDVDFSTFETFMSLLSRVINMAQNCSID